MTGFSRSKQWSMLFCAVFAVASANAAEHRADQIRFFEEHVRPLLADKCFKCHGADKQRGELRLDSLSAIISGGESGPAVEPGKPEESLLIESVRWESFEMPPTGRLEDRQIDVLAKWILMGAPWPGDDGLRKQAVAEAKISAEDRSYWAFQPIAKPTPPDVASDDWVRNDIDRFVLRKLDSEGLRPAGEATRLALIRRATFDLIGLPPSPEEIDDFMADDQPGAYERLVNRLLDSPRYGERWARHWLDLVRYAESDGFKQDAYRPHAWRYRDYVIRSFNDDKPYDRFIVEQLAGDEIAPHDSDALAATAFLRHWIYEYNQRDVRTQWDNILVDVTNVTSDVFLGLGMGCARCHDHKFDPILQEDYFRLKAFFTPLLPRDDIPFADLSQWQQYNTAQKEWKAATAEIRAQMDELAKPQVERARQRAANKFPPDITPMINKAADDRLPFEHQLAALAERQLKREVDKLKIGANLRGDQKTKWDMLQSKLAEYDHLKPKPTSPAFTVTDVGPIAPPTIIPGDRKQRDIAPGYLTVLDDQPAEIVPPTSRQSTGRRTALANWIASPDNPLTARVIVNRIWQQHFGVGLVSTASDFGNLGEYPSHPELLDFLAATFQEDGWRFKALHRRIMTSATYRQSALKPTPSIAMNKDPQNRWLWRMNVRRLDAEQIRDAILSISGELDLKVGGPSVDSTQPRRSIYNKVIRNRRDALLEVFDAADGFSSTDRRNTTTTPTQSLLMMNNDWPLKRSQKFASRLQREAGGDVNQLVERAYRLAYGRPPLTDERQAAVAFLKHVPQMLETEQQTDEPRVEEIAGREGLAAILKPTSKQNALTVKDNPSLPSADFTIEAVIVLHSLYPDATVRTIVSQWDSDSGHPGWAFGVTSTRSKYKPRNLILQLVGNSGYEVIASNLRPELNKPYYVAVSVDLSEASPAGVTFYLKDLSRDPSTLQIANVAHKVTKGYRSAEDLVIGGRAKSRRHHWDGLIDDVRISNRVLRQDELLPTSSHASDSIVGFWQFEAVDGFRFDGSGKDNHIDSLSINAAAPRSSAEAAIADFCHVLLNSNEFLYVD